MKKLRGVVALLLITVMVLCSCSGGSKMGGSTKLNDGKLNESSAKDVSEVDAQTLALTDASLEIFKGTCSYDQNSMVSPFSIIQAFGMCANGSRNKTLEEIETAFGCSLDELNEWALAYNVMISQAENPVMTCSNGLWFRDEGFEVNSEFMDAVSANYGGAAYKAPFDDSTVEDINGWVKDKTKDRIKKLISSLSSDDMTVIVNAVTFDGSWVDPYNEDAVEDDVFTTEGGVEKNAKLMYSVESEYIEGANFTGFRKYYKDGYSFVALLPEEGTTVEEVVDKLDGASFRKALSESQFGDVRTKLPKFKSEYDASNVIEAMNELGIRELFDPGTADLSGIGTSEAGALYIGKVVHKTFIDVNEEGTEAAAATGMIALAGCAPEMNEFEVYLDRPFVYAIVDDTTNLPLFLGTCMDVE